MTGFEFHLTPLIVKKIKHLTMQKNEKHGRNSAILQPDATSPTPQVAQTGVPLGMGPISASHPTGKKGLRRPCLRGSSGPIESSSQTGIHCTYPRRVTMKILLILLLVLLLPITVLAQSGNSVEFGNTTFYNYGGVSGTSQQFGNTEFYNFNNGQSATRQSFGSTDVYSSSSPGLSGTVQTFGNQSFGNWNNGTHSTHQSFGATQFDTYQRGNHTTNCTSQHFGNQTYTNCR